MNKPLFLAAVLAAVLVSILTVGTSLHAQQLTYSNTWAGNTYGGQVYKTVGGWKDSKHVQLSVNDMAVDTDGTVYTDSFWDEGGNEAAIYKNGEIIGRCDNVSHGWGRMGGVAVALDGNYVYEAISQSGDDGANPNLNKNGLRQYPDRGTTWLCIRRFHKDGTSAPFATGLGIFNDMMVVDQLTKGPAKYPAGRIEGMAVRGGMLYVSDSYSNRISAYDLNTMSGTPTVSWQVDSPGKIVFDGSGRLWMLNRASTPTVISYSKSGSLLPLTITFPATVQPSAIAWDAAKDRLLVCDQGVDQDIKFYNPAHLSGSPTIPTSYFGVKGGIHSGGDGAPRPLHFVDPSAVCVDGTGKIYVASSSSVQGCSLMSLESYQPNGALNWQKPLLNLEFVNCDTSDPADDTSVYGTGKHYTVDYSAAPGSGWEFKGYTVDRFRYPDDPRVHIGFDGGVFARRINGALYLFLTQQIGHEIGVLRFDPASGSETAIPYAFLSVGWHEPDAYSWPKSEPGSKAESTEWIWRDANGDGKIDAGEYSDPSANPSIKYRTGWGEWVDSRGDIWQSGHGHIRHFKMHLDASGRPAWDYAAGDVELLDPPTLPGGATWQHGRNPDDDDLARIIYEPTTDTMYLSGFTSEYPDDTKGMWGTCGRVVYRYDRWSKSPVIHQGYPIILSWGTQGDTATKSISLAGDYLFAVEARDPETVSIYNLDTVALTGTLTPDENVGSKGGWVDINYGLSAHLRKDGEYIVFAEEDLYEKSLIYRWKP
jgi:hypothetical protein